jgi:hypothetical protein
MWTGNMTSTRNNNAVFGSALIPALVLLWSVGFSSPAAGSDDAGTEGAVSETKPDKAMVVPYKSRPAPSHRVSLRDDRVYFVKELEETDDGYVLHTLEDEIIEVERANVAEIVEFKSE